MFMLFYVYGRYALEITDRQKRKLVREGLNTDAMKVCLHVCFVYFFLIMSYYAMFMFYVMFFYCYAMFMYVGGIFGLEDNDKTRVSKEAKSRYIFGWE